MLLSLIIPAYNAGKYLDDCLESCFRQDMDIADYEIIIINDGSTDNTLEIAERWKTDHPGISVISQENKGLSMARNAGISAAKGSYVMFIDSDDMIAGNCLGFIAERCSTDNLDMFRFCAADLIDGKVSRRYSYIDRGISTGREAMRLQYQVCAPFAAYKKVFLLSHGLEFHPGIYHEDNLFTPKAYYYAEKVASTDRIVYLVRQTPGSITRTPDPKRGYDLLTVIDMLDSFAQNEVTTEDRKFIYKQAADCINGCLKLMNGLPDRECRLLKHRLLEKEDIFRLMLKSSKLTHRIEGRLLTLFPQRMQSIYNILDIIHR